MSYPKLLGQSYRKSITLAEEESTLYLKEKACLEDHNTDNDNKRSMPER